MKNWFIKHREVLAYLVFGVLTTLLNIVLYALFSRLFGYTAAWYFFCRRASRWGSACC